jgi:hypothetical protein
MMRSLAIALLPLTVACGGGALSEAEAEVVYQAVNDVTTEVSGSAMSTGYRAAGADWSWEQTADGFSYSGTLTGGVMWSGTIDVVASYSTTSDMSGMGTTTYDFGMTLTDVEPVRQAVVLNGNIDMAMVYELSTTGFSMTYDTTADLDVTGDAKGHAEMNYSMTVATDGMSYTVTAEGDVNGHDVSGFTYAGTF